MSYQLGVDLGTTWSAAAVCRGAGPEPVALGERSYVVASVVHLGADGSFLLGEAAERRALSDPGRVVREFTRRIGDPTPVLVGRDPVPAETLAARFVAAVVGQVARREGGPASRVAVTHPAGWGPHKVESLRAALAGHGVGPVELLSEPQAAAVGHAHQQPVEPGAVVAVYDLGGGTFDAAVVRRTADGFDLLGTPDGLERLGGVDFDEAVFGHVRTALGPAWEGLDGTDPAVAAAVAGLRRECTAAREALSSDTVVHVPVMLPGVHTRVRLGRAEFEDMIRPAVAETVDALRRALDSAGVVPTDLAALLLVGGASRTPLVAELVSSGVGRPASVDVDPKGVTAAGAALVARAAEERAGAPVAVTPVEAVPVAVTPVAAAHGAPDVEPEGPATDGSAEPPAPRPPRQARPFAGVVARPRRPRVVFTVVAAAVAAAAVLAGAVVLAARPGPDAEASTPTPEPVTSSSVRVPAPLSVETEEPAPRRRAPAPDPTTRAPAPTSTAPPPTAEPVTTVPTTEPTTPPPTTEPTTTDPAPEPEPVPEAEPDPELEPGIEGAGEPLVPPVPDVGVVGAGTT